MNLKHFNTLANKSKTTLVRKNTRYPAALGRHKKKTPPTPPHIVKDELEQIPDMLPMALMAPL
jgi:hypothetical protein